LRAALVLQLKVRSLSLQAERGKSLGAWEDAPVESQEGRKDKRRTPPVDFQHLSKRKEKGISTERLDFL